MKLAVIYLYIAPLIGVAITGVISSLYIWWRHRIPAAKTLALILLVSVVYVVCHILEFLFISAGVKILCAKVAYPPVCVVSVGLFIFALQYTGRGKWVTRRTLVLLSIIPIITSFLIFTNESHNLIWSNVVSRPQGELLEVTHGPWFFVHAAYTHILALFGEFLLIHMLFRAHRFYRLQIILLLLAIFFPQLVGIISVLESSPKFFLVMVVLFSVTSVIMALRVFRFRWADVIPVARGTVIDSMSDGVMVLDVQNRIMDVNPLVQQLINRSGSAIGHHVEEVWPHWLDQIGLDNPHSKKEIVLNLNDEERTYDVRISPLTGWQDEIVSQIIVLRDITDRKQAEKNLHESEEKFRSIAERNFDAIYEIDLEGVITYISPAIERITGYDAEEIMGTFIHQYIRESRVPEVLSALDRVAKGESIEGLQVELLKKDNSVASIEVNACPIIKDGTVVGSQGVVRDITERKRREMQLKYLFEASRLINSTMDIEEIYKFISDSVQFLIGFDNFMIFLVSEDRKNAYMAYSEGVNPVEHGGVNHDEGLLYQCIERAEIVSTVDNIDTEMTEMKSQIIVPLMVKDQCVGALHISTYAPHGYEQGDVDILKLLSEVISSALRNSWLHNEIKGFNVELEERIKERAQRIENLLNTRQELQKEKSLQDGLMTIVASMEKLGLDTVGVFLVDFIKKKLDFHLGKGIELPDAGTSISLKNTEYFGVKCVLEKKTIHVKDSQFIKGKQIVESDSFVWVPIVVQNEAFAALVAGNKESIITEEDVKDLEILAGMCAVFIDRTRMLVEPVVEKTLETEIKNWLDPMEAYIVLEKKSERSFEIFIDLVTHGRSGFVVSREYPEKLKKKYNLVKTPTLWLSRIEGQNSISPDDLPKLYYIIGEFTRKSTESVILLDGLEYLITQIGFNTVLKHLHELKDAIILNNSRLIIPVNKETLSQKEFNMLEREFTIIEGLN